MKNCIFVIFLSLFLISSNAHAQSDNDSLINMGGIYFELSGRDNPDSFGGEIGLNLYTTRHLSYRAGFAFLLSESFKDTFWGGTLGLRYSFFKKTSPFIGLGVFGGCSKETVTNEYGESEEVVDDVIACVYPEIGVHFLSTDNSHITISGKYYITSEGRDYDFWYFSLGFAFLFE